MIGVDGQDLPQRFFFFGLVARHGAEPQPGIGITRIRYQDQVKDVARFFVLTAFRQVDALS